MKFTPRKVNLFNLVKLPLAYLGGVRVRTITDTEVVVSIKYRWMNQNPFRSMFWAAQGMAAEMPTGVLVMKAIDDSKVKVSMLVTKQEAEFFKKATGRILFSCKGGNEIREAIQESIKTGEGQVIVLISEGKNKDGVVVSRFQFHWSLRVKK
ncbi:thioesterase [Polaribacter sejongensis]|uniref:DUF4442 domain-containing protein n=1 Tax=Polaribacter sejongensis TaxID=985043 RepID=A0AAJ1QT65_9FLAO|nr:MULTISPECIES: DUF4442 domain-containing protein [Polaribacter]AUC23728.1 thioesterase [Polaribacter sejongensis]MDN3617914.1 DUF4442 domain-containing protein [Polaribacter undariae]UWD32054.1 DUF4442 domain-containing protein [Polaribacter undariae]